MEADRIGEQLAESVRPTRELGYQDTPARIIVDVHLPGGVAADQMFNLVDSARNEQQE